MAIQPTVPVRIKHATDAEFESAFRLFCRVHGTRLAAKRRGEPVEAAAKGFSDLARMGAQARPGLTRDVWQIAAEEALGTLKDAISCGAKSGLAEDGKKSPRKVQKKALATAMVECAVDWFQNRGFSKQGYAQTILARSGVIEGTSEVTVSRHGYNAARGRFDATCTWNKGAAREFLKASTCLSAIDASGSALLASAKTFCEAPELAAAGQLPEESQAADSQPVANNAQAASRIRKI